MKSINPIYEEAIFVVSLSHNYVILYPFIISLSPLIELFLLITKIHLIPYLPIIHIFRTFLLDLKCHMHARFTPLLDLYLFNLYRNLFIYFFTWTH